MRSHHLGTLLLALVLPACSGGGGSSSSPANNTVALMIGTDSGSDEEITAVVQGIALEMPGGHLTGNLLPAPREVVLADPLGRLEAIELEGVAPGDYVAVHLVIANDGMSVRMGDGRVMELDFDGPSLRMPFDGHVHTVHGRREFWLAVHMAKLDLRMDNQGLPSWNPRLAINTDRSLPLRNTQVTVTAIDAPAFTMDALLRPFGGVVPVTLTITEDSVLGDKDTRTLLTREEFFSMVMVGDRLIVEGTMSPGNVLTVTLALLRSKHRGDDDDDDNENEILGQVLSLDVAAETLRLQVLEILEGTAIVDRDPLPVLTVDGSRAEIEQDDVPFRNLPFSTIQVGDLVEVEWDGPLDNGVIRAEEIEIENELPELEGLVAEVLVQANTIIAVPRKDDPLLVGGTSVDRAEILITPDTFIFRDHHRNEIQLADVRVGERIKVHGKMVGPNRMEASSVRVRPE